jgi:hypothetical protein
MSSYWHPENLSCLQDFWKMYETQIERVINL